MIRFTADYALRVIDISGFLPTYGLSLTPYFYFMSTRQIRLSSFDQIKTRLKEFCGKKINIVLHDRTVLFGELKSIDNAQLNFVNMRLENFTLSLKEISEVYLDFKE